MPVLKNARHERFVQGVVKGISAGPAYTAAGYKATGNAAETAAARLFRNVQVQARRAELQGSTAKQITDVRDAARQHTLAAVETLVSVIGPKGAPLRPCCCGKRPPGSWPRQGDATYRGGSDCLRQPQSRR